MVPVRLSILEQEPADKSSGSRFVRDESRNLQAFSNQLQTDPTQGSVLQSLQMVQEPLGLLEHLLALKVLWWEL